MNEAEEHLKDDVERLFHPDPNLEHGLIVHLYRLYESGDFFSDRGWSSKSPRILMLEGVQKLSIEKNVEIYYGLADGKELINLGLGASGKVFQPRYI